jgi:serine/threonine protein kinase
VSPQQQGADARWEQLEAVFFAATELPAAERSDFLARTCAGDTDLRREAESLLASEHGSAHDIATVILGAATALFSEAPMEGTRLGAYRIEREIGRGGMGAVYLAARADDEFRKRVAIKLVKRGVDTDAVLKRFLQERQVLAGLDHPNIARLLDGGTSGDGRPWFALEYVEGRPIQIYCEEKKLSVAERCELLRKVCEPVHYAHCNLVIHRDLKPPNILVTSDGEPKLLDFGIARLLSLDPGENTIGTTTDSLKPLTPAYASPEQIRGEPVNTAADVFALGSVLFEMLTGAPPVRRPAQPGEREVGKPSVAAKTSALRKALEDDLDTIVLMATHPEASRRYQSVDQLSEDIRRYLNGRPVMARADTWGYRLNKFVVRNRWPMGAAAVCLALMLGGVTSVLWQAHQTSIQRQRAEDRLGALVELANGTLLNVQGSIERLPGGTEARREITRTTLQYLDKLNTENGNDARVLSALASAYLRMAKIEGDPTQPNLGDLKGAEESYRKGAKILDGLLAADPQNRDIELRVAEACNGLGDVLAAMGRSPGAVEQYREGLSVIGKVLARDPNSLPSRKAAAALHIALDAPAAALDDKFREKDILEQVPLNTQLLAEYPKDTDLLLNLAQNYSQLGMIAGRRGSTRESLADHEKSVGWREQAFALRPNDVAAQRELMMAYGHIGDMLGSPFLWSLGDTRGAREYYDKAARIAEDMVRADASNKQAHTDLGIVLMRLGTVHDGPGEVRASLETLKKAEDILEPLLASGTRNFGYTTQLAILHEFKAKRLIQAGDDAGALASYRRSLDLCVMMLPIRPTDANLLHQQMFDVGGIATLLAKTGDRAGAFETVRQIESLGTRFRTARDKDDQSFTARAAEWSGEVYENLARRGTGQQRASDYREAAAAYRTALDEWRKLDADTTAHFAPEIKAARASLARSQEELAR